MASETTREQHRPFPPVTERAATPERQRRILSNNDLAQTVYQTLQANSGVDVSQIEVEAHEGEITLRGRVPYREDKENLEEQAEAIDGVRLVRNYLRSLSDITAQPTPARGGLDQRMLASRFHSLSRF